MPSHFINADFLRRVMFAVIGPALCGCAADQPAPQGPQRAAETQPAVQTVATRPSNPFGPVPPPDGFDRQKARLTLAQLPDDPAAPGRPTSRPAAVPDAARQRLDAAGRYFAEQRYSETIIEAEKALRYEPNLAEAHRLIALSSLLSGNESRARLSAERVLSIHPDNLACQYVLGRFAEKAGKHEEAARFYRTALKCTSLPADRSYQALTQHHLGRLLFSAGYYAAAATLLEAFEETLAALGEKVIDNPELATVARVQRAEAALTAARARGYLGEYATAADALGRAAGRLTDDFDLRAEYIRMLVRARRTDAAAEQAAQLLADSQGSAAAVQLLVAVYAASGHPDQAVAAIKSVVARQPDNIELWLVYVDTLVESGRANEAYHAARDLLSRHPESSAARWKLIRLHRVRGDWADFTAQLAEYLASEPSDSEQVTREIHDIPADSIASVLKSIEAAATATQPSGALASAREVIRGTLLERIDRLDEARRLYESAIARTPDFMPAALAAGELFLSRCRWNEAIPVLESAQKARDRPSSEIEFLLGRARDGLDQAAGAAAHYDRAVQLDRTNLRAVLALARLHERFGNIQAAQKQYQNAITADAAFMPAREGLIHLLLAQVTGRSAGRDQQAMVNRALGELGEMQKLAPNDPATLRSAALVQFLFARDQKQYLDTLRKLLTHHPAEQQTREDLFRALLEVREYPQALEVARDIVARDRCSATGHEMLATAQLRLLDFEAAASQYDRMLEMYPCREAWLQQHAELLALMRRYEQSVALFERLLALESVKGKPDREMLYRDKMLPIYRRAKQFDRARELNEKWLADETEQGYRQRYRTMLLQTDLAAEDYDRYLSRCREWLRAEPDSPELHRLLVLGLLRADRREEAVALALEWLSRTPDDDRLDWFGDVLQAARQYAGAIDIARGLLSATEKAEEKRGRLQNLATLLVAARRFDAAIVSLRQLIMQAENTGPEFYVYQLKKTLAHVYVQADRPEEATRYLNKMLNDFNEEMQLALARLDEQYQKLVEHPSSTPEDRKNVARELERARKLAEAAADPRKADILRQMYLAYQRQGQVEVAEQRLREALALAPGEAGICNDLGYSLADNGKNLEEARRLIALAVGEEPATAAYLDSYGWVLYKLGRFAEAQRWLEWASSLDDGEDPVIHDHLGDALWRSGRKEEAVANWKRSLQIHEKETREGESTAEKDLPDRVGRKLAAIQAGKSPPVAPVGSKQAE